MEMVKAKVVGKNMERILGFVLCVSVGGGGGGALGRLEDACHQIKDHRSSGYLFLGEW